LFQSKSISKEPDGKMFVLLFRSVSVVIYVYK